VPLLPLHQAHDPRALIARWREVAKAAGMQMKVLVEMDGEKVFYLQKRDRLASRPVYLSTGVHGDEAGSAWGLLSWAQREIEQLRHGNHLIFPCMNPHGLRANTRMDCRGFDINRRFHIDTDPLCGPWLDVVRQSVPKLGLCLHEDYDAQGFYVYELNNRPKAVSYEILKKCAKRISADPRRMIDGRRAKDGVIRPRAIPSTLPGMPEAIVLWQLGCPVTLTFETPSEFSLDDRVHTQADFVNAAIRLAARASNHQP
jgi:murein peptide amidase A